jgi:hypothetical protein
VAPSPFNWPGSRKRAPSRGILAPAVSHRRRRPEPDPRTSSPPATSPPPRAPVRDIEAIIDTIANGELDLHVEALAEVVSRRLELLRAARDALLMATLRRGDRVQINHSACPLYLHGELATVIGSADDTVVVRLDRPVGRFTNGEVRCPPGVLEPIGPGPVPE